ncbi:hypothetical protein OKW21_001355 [Catalinimonas alkaloidigena]|uniref:hypothetical protein n=1 Tax=Catalinimonas alkaloidigena TaxID=1075417 RepID=UPI0024053F28|nr:hypothetical protein [Catalinimonas alkaloidigena]MDF9796092.1 hypothetical protein [Catalinimonas alkaloidigena]
MTLQFRKGWNQVAPKFANANDAAMIRLLNPDEALIQTVLNEAHLNGGWTDTATKNLFQCASRSNGPIVSIRAGAHQVEDQENGFQLHIGALYNNVNWHLNIQQTISGRMYISSVSRGNPREPDYHREERTGPIPHH